MAGSGMVRRGEVGHGKARSGRARHGTGNSRLKIGNSLSPSVMARLGWSGQARLGGAWNW